MAEVEEVLQTPLSEKTSRSSGRPLRIGWTSTGRLIAVVYGIIDAEPLVVYPVTAFELHVPKEEL